MAIPANAKANNPMVSKINFIVAIFVNSNAKLQKKIWNSELSLPNDAQYGHVFTFGDRIKAVSGKPSLSQVDTGHYIIFRGYDISALGFYGDVVAFGPFLKGDGK